MSYVDASALETQDRLVNDGLRSSLGPAVDLLERVEADAGDDGDDGDDIDLRQLRHLLMPL